MSIKITLEKITRSIHPITGLILAISAVSTASILIRFAQRTYPSLIIAAGRLSIASLILLPFFAVRDKSRLKDLRKSDFLFLAGAGIFLGLHFASWIRSLALTNVISSVVLVTTTPIWVSLISFFIFKERLNVLFYIGLAVAMVGVIVISTSAICGINDSGLICRLSHINQLHGSSLEGNLLALTGAICAAGYILCGKKVREKLDNLDYIFIIYSIASILLVIAVAFSKPVPIKLLQPAFGWIILTALIPQLIGHSMINWSLGQLPASYVSLSLLGEPIGSTLLAFILLNELPTFTQILGSAVILSGLILATKPVKKKAIN